MKEGHYGRGLGIDSCQIGAFATITVRTGQREIGERIIAPMLASTDVFDMETNDRSSVLGQLTIFTVMPRAFTHHMAERLVHQDAT
jgi:hypothetical protein